MTPEPQAYEVTVESWCNGAWYRRKFTTRPRPGNVGDSYHGAKIISVTPFQAAEIDAETVDISRNAYKEPAP